MKTGQNFDCSTNYPLELLDHLITVSLHPRNVGLHPIEDTTAQQLIIKIADEAINVQKAINSQAFAVNTEQELATTIRKYHTSLIDLLDQVSEHKEVVQNGKLLDQVYSALTDCLEYVISFIETRYWTQLNLEERMPRPQLKQARKEVSARMCEIQTILDDEHSRQVYALIRVHLHDFAECTVCSNRVSYRAAMYRKELITKLLEVEVDGDHYFTNTYAPIDRLMIYLNFNSKAYIRLLTSEINTFLDMTSTQEERMERLLFLFKEFKQLPVKSGIIFNPNFKSLHEVMHSWFSEEIAYLEKKGSFVANAGNPGAEVKKPKQVRAEQKITCNLSTDQMGLILRAADEARVILARSMSHVFKSLVPHLSTPNKSELSYNGLRSKSYEAEKRDKDAAIASLERIITKIREY